MPLPADGKVTGDRMTGEAMQKYMESFADRFLKGRIRFNVEVKRVYRNADGKWVVDIEQGDSLVFDKLALCTGVSNAQHRFTIFY